MSRRLVLTKQEDVDLIKKIIKKSKDMRTGSVRELTTPRNTSGDTD